jgi:hypothetical protein
MTFVEVCLVFLCGTCEQVPLISRVADKEYITFRHGNVVARPAKQGLFVADAVSMATFWHQWLTGEIEPAILDQFLYTSALAPCLAMELFDRQNKKGPATYFELLLGHIFGKIINESPSRRVSIPILDRHITLTMDFLYRLPNNRGVHLAVKMSTRERVVQAWAHQRLLDVSFGQGAYTGILAVCSETKLDSRTLEVIEICVPDQWLAYQVGLAKMTRIYYLDPPARYLALSAGYPDVIQIKALAEAFGEKADLWR